MFGKTVLFGVMILPATVAPAFAEGRFDPSIDRAATQILADKIGDIRKGFGSGQDAFSQQKKIRTTNPLGLRASGSSLTLIPDAQSGEQDETASTQKVFGPFPEGHVAAPRKTVSRVIYLQTSVQATEPGRASR